MVIFGAGASFDTLREVPGPTEYDERPPTAAQLFNVRPEFGWTIDRYTVMRSIIDELRSRGADIETKLAEMTTDADSRDPRRHVELAAIRFYLRDIFIYVSKEWPRRVNGQRTNYHTLLSALRRWQVEKREYLTLVTFNYDTLLDQACMDALDYNFLPPPSGLITEATYVRANDCLLKLHGSTNWTHPLSGTTITVGADRVTTENAVIRAAADFRIEKQDFRFGFPGLLPNLWDGARPTIPALAVPLTEKLTFECPSEHIQKLQRYIPEVSRILCIGWRGAETYFARMLANGRREVKVFAVIGGDPKSPTRANLQRVWPDGEFEFQPGGFSSIFAGPELADPLRKFLDLPPLSA